MFEEKSTLQAFFHANKFHSQSLKLFAKPFQMTKGPILPRNSPLTPILKHYFLLLNEAGALKTMQRKWFGESIPKVKSHDTRTLSIGQILLTFLIILVAVGVSLFILELR